MGNRSKLRIKRVNRKEVNIKRLHVIAGSSLKHHFQCSKPFAIPFERIKLMKTVEPVSCTNQGSEQRAYLAFPFHKSTQMRCLISRSSCSIYDNGFIVCRRRKNKSRKTGGFILEDDFASSIRGIILERNLRRKYEKIGNVVVSSERGAGSNG